MMRMKKRINTTSELRGVPMHRNSQKLHRVRRRPAAARVCRHGGKGNLAERAGFEPALGYKPKHAFQACDLNRSSTSPNPKLYRGPSPRPSPRGEGENHSSLRGGEPAEAVELPPEKNG